MKVLPERSPVRRPLCPHLDGQSLQPPSCTNCEPDPAPCPEPARSCLPKDHQAPRPDRGWKALGPALCSSALRPRPIWSRGASLRGSFCLAVGRCSPDPRRPLVDQVAVSSTTTGPAASFPCSYFPLSSQKLQVCLLLCHYSLLILVSTHRL